MYSIQWVFLVVILLHVPINLFTARNMLFTFFEVERTDKNWNIITVAMTYFIFIIPILYPDILGFLGIFGGIFCCSDDLIVPFLIGYRLRCKPPLSYIVVVKDKSLMRFVYALVVVAALFISMNSVIFSIVGDDIFTRFNKRGVA